MDSCCAIVYIQTPRFSLLFGSKLFMLTFIMTSVWLHYDVIIRFEVWWRRCLGFGAIPFDVVNLQEKRIFDCKMARHNSTLMAICFLSIFKISRKFLTARFSENFASKNFLTAGKFWRHRKSIFHFFVKISFISVQIVAFTCVTTERICTFCIAIAVVRTNKTFINIFAFGSGELKIQIHKTTLACAEKSPTVIGACCAWMAIVITCSTLVNAYVNISV